MNEANIKAYEVLQKEELTGIRSRGYLCRHKKERSQGASDRK